MGCAPLGFRPANGNVVPYPPYEPWQNHFVSSIEPSAPPALRQAGRDCDEPPPQYTEEAMEGHITLMKGQPAAKRSSSREAWSEVERGFDTSRYAGVSLSELRPPVDVTMESSFHSHPESSPRRPSSRISRSSSIGSAEPLMSSTAMSSSELNESGFHPELVAPDLNVSSFSEHSEQPSELHIFPPRTTSRSQSPRPVMDRRGTYPFIINNTSPHSNPFPPPRSPPHNTAMQPNSLPENSNILLSPDLVQQDYGGSLHPMTDTHPPPPPPPPPPGLLPLVNPYPLSSHYPTRLPPLQPQLTSEQRRNGRRKRRKRRTWHGELHQLPTAQ